MKGWSNQAEFGAGDCISGRAGREFIALILKDLWFMDIVPDINGLIAQGVGKDLFDALCVIDRKNAMKIIEEHFIEGGRSHVSSIDGPTDGQSEGSDGLDIAG